MSAHDYLAGLDPERLAQLADLRADTEPAPYDPDDADWRDVLAAAEAWWTGVPEHMDDLTEHLWTMAQWYATPYGLPPGQVLERAKKDGRP